MPESKSTRLHAIVLAAGLGSRFGGGKLLAPFRGRPLVAAALESALAAPVASVSVALSGDAALELAIRDAAARLERTADVRLIRVDDPARGMGASLGAAARSLPDRTAGVFVFLGDMPLIPPPIAPALAAALTGPGGIVAPVHGGRRGHPVLFGGDWIPALRTLDGDGGAQALIREAGERFIAVQTNDPGVLFDIDRPEDLAACQ